MCMTEKHAFIMNSEQNIIIFHKIEVQLQNIRLPCLPFCLYTCSRYNEWHHGFPLNLMQGEHTCISEWEGSRFFQVSRLRDVILRDKKLVADDNMAIVCFGQYRGSMVEGPCVLYKASHFFHGIQAPKSACVLCTVACYLRYSSVQQLSHLERM